MMDEYKLKNIQEALFQRLNIKSPEETDIDSLLRVAFLQNLLPPIHLAMKTMNDKDIMEVLRAVTDALELCHQEEENDWAYWRSIPS